MIKLIETKVPKVKLNEGTKKYFISSLSGSGELDGSFYTNDPKKAIEIWFKLQAKNPISAAIDTESKENSVLLLKSATPDFIEGLYSKYRCGYKKDFLLNEIKRTLENGNRYFNGTEGMPDSVHPFSVG